MNAEESFTMRQALPDNQFSLCDIDDDDIGIICFMRQKRVRLQNLAWHLNIVHL